MPPEYVPERGHLVWLTFDPPTGHAQAGTRPALVISPANYNRKVGLALLCPVTSQVKGYPFEVLLPAGLKVQGAILSDRIKSLDWRVRRVRFAGTVPDQVLEDAAARIMTLVDPGEAR